MSDKLRMSTKNTAQKNIDAIGTLFPHCITESIDDQGEIRRMIDFESLTVELQDDIVEGSFERFQFVWPNKTMSKILANTPIRKTLRPYKEESLNFDQTENLYIEGDNLDVLKVLQENYLGLVDVIYLDPPYNTGTDLIYKNNFSQHRDSYERDYRTDEAGNKFFTNRDTNGRFHSDWLSMMYPRIRLARDLLSDSGFFLISIDHNELFNLGQMCDEIFGFNNRIGVITVVHKPEGRNQAKFIGPSSEYMFVYAKDESVAELQRVTLDEEQSKLFDQRDEGGAYRLKNFIRLSDGKYATRESKPAFWYPIYVSEDCEKLSISTFENSFPVYPITNQGIERTWKTTKETFLNRYRKGDIIAKKERDGVIIYEKLRENQVIKTHWINRKYHGFHFGTKILDDLLGVKTFDFPKSVYLMRDIFKLFSPKDGLILDFFSGSGTSAHGIMMLNFEEDSQRRYIMVQIPESIDSESDAYKAGYSNICEIGKERIRRVGRQISEENKQLKLDGIDKTGTIDLGFRVLKLDSSNMKDVYYTPDKTFKHGLDELLDNVKEDRTPEDLLFQVMLELGVNLSSKIKEYSVDGKKIFSVDEDYLVACFDVDVSESVVTEIAKKKPHYAVMRDNSMSNDNVAVNFEQIFKTYSPETIRKVI